MADLELKDISYGDYVEVWIEPLRANIPGTSFSSTVWDSRYPLTPNARTLMCLVLGVHIAKMGNMGIAVQVPDTVFRYLTDNWAPYLLDKVDGTIGNPAIRRKHFAFVQPKDLNQHWRTEISDPVEDVALPAATCDNCGCANEWGMMNQPNNGFRCYSCRQDPWSRKAAK